MACLNVAKNNMNLKCILLTTTSPSTSNWITIPVKNIPPESAFGIKQVLQVATVAIYGYKYTQLYVNNHII